MASHMVGDLHFGIFGKLLSGHPVSGVPSGEQFHQIAYLCIVLEQQHWGFMIRIAGYFWCFFNRERGPRTYRMAILLVPP